MAEEQKALETVDIKIATLSKKEMAGQYGPYNLISILDEVSGRNGAASGKWTDSWKVGDIINGQWSLRKYTDKNGTERMSWDIKNPTPSTYTGNKSGNYAPKKPNIVDAYTVAAMLAPVMFKDSKFKLESFVKLADKIKENFDKATPSEIVKPKEDKVPVIKVDAEEKVTPTPVEKKVEAPKPSPADFDIPGDDEEDDLF